jgi:NAD(P)-dependent dehydrogenase (short-subunit alcohol dehydrogenase family)
MPRVALVVGAQGVLGHLVAQAFEAAGWHALRAGRRPDPDPSFRLVDVSRPETVLPACREADVVVSTVAHPDLVLERTILRHGGTLINLASLDAAARATLERESAGAAGLVVLHAGLAPGVTTLVAAELLADHPEADALEVGLTLYSAAVSGRAGAEFAFRLLARRSHHPTAAIPFPAPIGVRRCMDVGLDGEGWFGPLGNGRATSLYFCVVERVLHAGLLAANDLRLINKLPFAMLVPARPLVPKTATHEPVFEWVAARVGERRLGAATVEATGDYGGTAAATVVLAEAAVAAQARRPALRGAVGPEAVTTLAELRAPLAAAGIRVVQRA